MLKSQNIRKVTAAKIIQSYWCQYLDYIGFYHRSSKNTLHSDKQAQVNQKKQDRNKEKLCLVDYEYRPQISNKSRKLAQKRRKDMGLGRCKVEDALIKENKMRVALRERSIHENIIRDSSMSKTERKSTKLQADMFYQKQKNYRANIENRLDQVRNESKSPETSELTLKPKINHLSKSLKRDYSDLMNWKKKAEGKLSIKRKQKEVDEEVSIKSYKSKSSRSFIKNPNISKGILSTF